MYHRVCYGCFEVGRPRSEDQLISGSARLSEPRITALRGSPHSAEDTKRTGEAL